MVNKVQYNLHNAVEELKIADQKMEAYFIKHQNLAPFICANAVRSLPFTALAVSTGPLAPIGGIAGLSVCWIKDKELKTKLCNALGTAFLTNAVLQVPNPTPLTLVGSFILSGIFFYQASLIK